MNSAVRRTLIMYVACLLGALPLLSVVDDAGWLFDAYLAMAAVLLPAVLLRLRRPPGALQIWPGIALLAMLLIARYLPEHAILGVLPGRGTWHELMTLLDDLHDSMRTQSAPVHSTPPMRFALSLMLALVTALVDLLAVVGRHGALAGLPLLVIFSASGAMVRGSVPWPVFALAGIGFLLLLSLDAPDDAATWGHRIARSDQRRTGSSTALTGVRIGAVALVVGLLGAALVPVSGHNLVADAIRHTGSGGSGGGTSVDPFAGLAGNLRRGDPIDLATVTITKTGGPDVQPFYLRTNVLETVTSRGWVESDPRFTVPVDDQRFPLFPAAAGVSVPRLSFVATINTDRLTGPPPVFAYPTQIAGLNDDVQWSPDAQTLIGKVKKRQTYVVTAQQPAPSVRDLNSVIVNGQSGAIDDGRRQGDVRQWLSVPQQPALARQTLDAILAGPGASGPSRQYAIARRINDYFTNPGNGFSYSLSTVKGDSGSDLVDFLTYKKGFCQQYAAAMGVLLRMAGVPSRVVIGFSHSVPDSSGSFTITSADAHAWVEAYLPGSGWVPFDPTPLAGISGGAASDLPWAPHPAQSGATVAPTGLPAETEPNPHQNQSQSPGAEQTAASARTATQWGWLGFAGALVLVLVLLAVPWLVRALRTRRRMRAARAGDSEALWAELADTAKDLGYVWSPARTPRQVADWLSGPAGAAQPALSTLARTVEQARYAPLYDAGADGVRELAEVRQALRRRLTWTQRLRTRLLPASVLPRLRARKQH